MNSTPKPISTPSSSSASRRNRCGTSRTGRLVPTARRATLASTRCSPSAEPPHAQLRPLQLAAQGGEQAQGGGGDVLGCGRSARASRSGRRTRAAPASGTNASSPWPRSRSSRVGSAGPKRVSRAARGRAASWPMRRKPSRRRACSSSGLQPQGRRRQIQHGLWRVGGQKAARAEPGPGPGRGQPAGHGQPVGQAQPVEAPAQIRQQRALAAEQMAAAGEVDGEPIGAVDHHPRAVAGAPQAQRARARRHRPRARRPGRAAPGRSPARRPAPARSSGPRLAPRD